MSNSQTPRDSVTYEEVERYVVASLVLSFVIVTTLLADLTYDIPSVVFATEAVVAWLFGMLVTAACAALVEEGGDDD